MSFNKINNIEKDFIQSLDKHQVNYSYVLDIETITKTTNLGNNTLIIANNKIDSQYKEVSNLNNFYIKARFKKVECLKYYIDSISNDDLYYEYLPSIFSLANFIDLFLEGNTNSLTKPDLNTLTYSQDPLFRFKEFVYQTDVTLDKFHLLLGDNLLFRILYFNKNKNLTKHKVANVHSISSYSAIGNNFKELYLSLLSLVINKLSQTLQIDKEQLTFKSFNIYKMMLY